MQDLFPAYYRYGNEKLWIYLHLLFCNSIEVCRYQIYVGSPNMVFGHLIPLKQFSQCFCIYDFSRLQTKMPLRWIWNVMVHPRICFQALQLFDVLTQLSGLKC